MSGLVRGLFIAPPSKPKRGEGAEVGVSTLRGVTKPLLVEEKAALPDTRGPAEKKS